MPVIRDKGIQLQDGSRVFRQPKTAKGRRLISLSPSTMTILREYREQQEEMRQELGKMLTEDDLVFYHVDGTPLLPNSVSHTWTELANRTGLKGIRLHDARHTHVSLMLKQGVHPSLQEVAEKCDAIFNGNANENSDPNESKMLASGEGIECRPYRSRTCDTLIKSLVYDF